MVQVQRFTLVLLFGTLISCQKLESNKDSVLKDFNIDVIYGEDNRMDFFQIQDPHWLELAQSTSALIDKDQLRALYSEKNELMGYSIESRPYGLSRNLCPDEPFFHQPMASFCSSFLIGPDVMVTAGHCLRNAFNCENVRFVFGYHFSDPSDNPLHVSTEQVYQCKSIIHTETNAITGRDLAVIRLDRKVTDHSPLLVRTEGRVANDAELTVIGYPSGLPGKIAHGGLMRDNDQVSYFVSSLDTYGGNSGSAVFNSETRLVEGVLVRGDTDFSYDVERKCRISNLCQQAGCRGEDVVRIQEVLRHLTPADLTF
jgi:hypothetical protein